MEALEADDGPVVFQQIEVDPTAVDVVTDLVRLFAEVIDGLELRADDVIVARPESGPWTLATPEYLVLLTRDIAALAGRGRPRALRPSEVSSDLLDQAGLLASIASATETPFAALEEFFARIGLPIDAPYPP